MESHKGKSFFITNNLPSKLSTELLNHQVGTKEWRFAQKYFHWSRRFVVKPRAVTAAIQLWDTNTFQGRPRSFIGNLS